MRVHRLKIKVSNVYNIADFEDPMSGSQSQNNTTSNPRTRRTGNFWEPIFNPEDNTPFPSCNWNFTNGKAPEHMLLRAQNLVVFIQTGGKSIFKSIKFIECDFIGTFDLTPRKIVFTNCHFFKCDFGLSSWKNAKFTKCTFDSVSFTQSNWIECDFRDCVWKNVSLSGSDTVMTNTVINNPRLFIKSAYTRLDKKVLRDKNVKYSYQKMRLESTKLTIARSMSLTLLNNGDEKAYYEAVRASSNQSSRYQIFESIYNILNGRVWLRIWSLIPLILGIIEFFVLNVAGAVNAWGRSVARPLLIGFVIITGFATIYARMSAFKDWSTAFVKSSEITLLVGYSNYSLPNIPIKDHYIVLLNMILGLLWYVIFIPTLVNRLSRVR